MAKSNKQQQKSNSRKHGVSLHKFCEDAHRDKKRSKEKKDWEDAVCSVCMEFPHNAVLLLCSSYDKGCRPYMCATSRRLSNCLQQYLKAYTNSPSTKSQPWDWSMDNPDLSGLPELLCPLCRGQVKGCTVVDPARKFLNRKKRSCMHDNCSFIGSYKALKKHVKLEHPLARRPREMDPSHVEKWKKLENERDLNDVYSTIMSTMPGAIVVGDYVIETNYYVGGYGGGWNSSPQFSSDFENDLPSGRVSLLAARHQGRLRERYIEQDLRARGGR